LGAGCGSSPSASSVSPVGQVTASPAGATPAASPVAKFGASVLVTDPQGFPYRVSITALTLVVQAETADHRQLIAPPGQAYITVVVQVANAATDRPDPWLRVQDSLSLSVPKAEISQVQPSSQPAWSCFGDRCRSGSATVVSLTGPDPLPVGGSADISLVVVAPVLSTAPLGDITVTVLQVPIPTGPG
jgi:hypothetical protein